MAGTGHRKAHGCRNRSCPSNISQRDRPSGNNRKWVSHPHSDRCLCDCQTDFDCFCADSVLSAMATTVEMMRSLTFSTEIIPFQITGLPLPGHCTNVKSLDYTHTWTKRTGSIVTFHKQQAQEPPLRIPYSVFVNNP